MRNFWYMAKTKSFIYVDPLASKLTIQNSTFRNFLFIDGIITNVNDTYTKFLVINENVHDNINVFTCLSKNASFGDCHLISIQNSTFDGYLQGNYLFKSSPPLFSPTKSSEAFIMRIRSLNGPIVIKDSKFRNMITLRRESQNTPSSSYTFCSKSTIKWMSTYKTVENVARMVRKASVLFKQVNKASNYTIVLSTCLDIRNLKKGLILYGNTFEKIYSTNAPALHLYGFENTLGNYYFLALNKYFCSSISYNHR